MCVIEAEFVFYYSIQVYLVNGWICILVVVSVYACVMAGRCLSESYQVIPDTEELLCFNTLRS